MTKFSMDDKIEMVLEYIHGNDSFRTVSNRWGLKSHANLITWVKLYESSGFDGLKYNCSNTTSKFKMEVIRSIEIDKLSLNEAAVKFKVPNTSVIYNWLGVYRKVGCEGVFSIRKERPTMKKDLEDNISLEEQNKLL